jgi:hypothetical protein
MILINATFEGSTKTRHIVFPFTVIVEQEEMKLDLLLNVIDPKIGGVMRVIEALDNLYSRVSRLTF